MTKLSPEERKQFLIDLKEFAAEADVDYKTLLTSMDYIESVRDRVYAISSKLEEKAGNNATLYLYAAMLGLSTTLSASPSPVYPQQAVQALLQLCEAMNAEFKDEIPAHVEFNELISNFVKEKK